MFNYLSHPLPNLITYTYRIFSHGHCWNIFGLWIISILGCFYWYYKVFFLLTTFGPSINIIIYPFPDFISIRNFRLFLGYHIFMGIPTPRSTTTEYGFVLMFFLSMVQDFYLLLHNIFLLKKWVKFNLPRKTFGERIWFSNLHFIFYILCQIFKRCTYSNIQQQFKMLSFRNLGY